MDLTALGWTSTLAEAFAPYAADGLIAARVALEHTHIYRVWTAEGEWLARVSGRLRHHAASRADFPAVGDWVAVDRAVHGQDARIRVVLPRFSRFARRAAGDPTEQQIVAANVNTVFLVGGLDNDFNPRRIERYLLVAWESGASPVVVLNKMDLVNDPAPYIEDVKRLAPAVPVHAVSARIRESLSPLRSYPGTGQTVALLGSSGVGKSTIVNQLIETELVPTHEVREWDSRGRHTTTARQMIVLPEGGVLIDTPGMRELQLWETGEALSGVFADIDRLGAQCRFRDCRHEQEPGCAVRLAVEAGELAPERLASFLKLRNEQEFSVRQQDQRAQIEQKRKARIGSKALTRRLRDKGRE